MTELGQWSTSSLSLSLSLSLSSTPPHTGRHTADAENKNTLADELTAVKHSETHHRRLKSHYNIMRIKEQSKNVNGKIEKTNGWSI